MHKLLTFPRRNIVKTIVGATLQLALLNFSTLSTPAWSQGHIYERQVLLPNGKPAVGAKVRAFFSAESQPALHTEIEAHYREREVKAHTDATGKYNVQAKTAQERLTMLVVDVPGCALQFDDWFGAKKTLKLVNDKPVEGQVKDKNGKPVSGARVSVSLVGTNTYTPIVAQHPLQIRFPELATRSQPDGRFRLRSTNNGPLGVDVQLWAVVKSGARTMMGTTERFSKKSYSIVVYPNVSVRGQVVDYATAKPLPNARIQFVDGALGQKPHQTNAQGRFHFEGLPGHFARHLTVTHPDYPDAVMDVRTDRQVIDDKQLQNEIIIGLRPVAKVFGKVVDENTGKDLPIRVSVMTGWSQKSGVWTQSMGASTTTFVDNGSFVLLAPVGSGALAIEDASAEGILATQRTPIEVGRESQQNLSVKVRRQPGYLVRIEPREGSERVPFRLFRRTPEEDEYLGFNEILSFRKAAQWGETIEIRGIGNDGKEVFPWTKITASPDQWPTLITYS